MLTVNRIISTFGDEAEMEIKGLSTDEKPENLNGFKIAVNSWMMEQDTGDFYYLKQQGSESTETTTLVDGDVLSNPTQEMDFQWYQDTLEPFSIPSNLVVILDGVEYSCTQNDDLSFGAVLGENYSIDFSQYPFRIQFDVSDDIWMNFFTERDNGGDHTVSLLTKNTVVVPTVWEKIGGSSQPSGELLVEINIDEWFDNTPPNSIYYEYITDVDLPDSITVDWNGASYQCTNGSTEESYKWYGAPWDDTIGGYDFEEYPFHLSYSVDSESDNIVYYIYAESSDTPVTVKIYG